MIYPPWTVLSGRAFLTNVLPPLGILSIAATLEESGFCVRVIDTNAERMDSQTLEERLRAYQPRFVGITVLSSIVVVAHSIAKLVKRIVPDCVVVFGGVHAELYPATMLRNSAIDVVIRGDGEKPMRDIVSGRSWSDIPGCSFRTAANQVRTNPPAPLVMDLDEYPMPAYHLVNFANYYPSASSYRRLPAMNLIMTRGCPGKCSFCNSAMTTLRHHSPRRIFQQIKLLREEYGVLQVQFYDDTFTVNKQCVYELCDLLAADKTDITFSCYVRGDCFSDEMAQKLKAVGCHQVMVGIETGSEKIMKSIRKPIDKQRYRNLVEIAHRHGIEVRAGFIIGNLGETWETMQETLKFAIDLDVDFFQLSISTPYPGTQLFLQADREGRLKHKEYKFYGQSDPIVRLDDLSADDILDFEKYAFRRFYMRPRMVLRQLKRISHPRQLRDLYNAFKIFVLSRGTGNTPNWKDWNALREEDQLDLNLLANDQERLTFEIRLPLTAA